MWRGGDRRTPYDIMWRDLLADFASFEEARTRADLSHPSPAGNGSCGNSNYMLCARMIQHQSMIQLIQLTSAIHSVQHAPSNTVTSTNLKVLAGLYPMDLHTNFG
jgi:hypothetical protein